MRVVRDFMNLKSKRNEFILEALPEALPAYQNHTSLMLKVL